MTSTTTTYEQTSNEVVSLRLPYYSSGLRARFQIDALKPPVSNQETTKYADIGYDIDEGKYKVLAATRVAAGGLEREVPPQWPRRVEGAMCWNPEDIVEEDYVYNLTESDKEEIKAALSHFKGLYCRFLRYPSMM